MAARFALVLAFAATAPSEILDNRGFAAALALALLATTAVLSLTLPRRLELPKFGCLGVFLARPLGPWTPLEDLALRALACCLPLGARSREAAVPPRRPA